MKPYVRPIAAAIAATFATAAAVWTFSLPATGIESSNEPHAEIGASLMLTGAAASAPFIGELAGADSVHGRRGSFPVVARFARAAIVGPVPTSAGVAGLSYESGSATPNPGHAIHQNQVDAALPAVFEPPAIGYFGPAYDPGPVDAVIPVSPFSNPDKTPNPSNWVAEIPEPETYAMLLAGLGMLGLIGRRRMKNGPPQESEVDPAARGA